MKKCPECGNTTMNFMKRCPTCGTDLDESCAVSFGRALLDDANKINAQKNEEKAEFAEHIRQMDRNGIAYCPKCYSPDLSANHRGWKLIPGFIGSSKIIVTCLKCGHQFKPGK